MGLLSPAPDEVQPWAYLSDGMRLYEVLSVEGATVTLQNCSTLFLRSTTVADVLAHFTLARRAPSSAPDLP